MNSKRYTEKRPTEFKIMNLNEPFNQKIFNFNKINQNEILLSLFKENEFSDSVENQNLIIINNSPIDGNLYSCFILI